MYGFTSDLLGELLNAAAVDRPDYIPLDDVFVTGILREKIGASFWDWSTLIRYWPDREFDSCKIVIRRQNNTEQLPSYYDTHKRNKLGSYNIHTDWANYTKHENDAKLTLGECYAQKQPPNLFVAIVLSEDALGMAEVWEKVEKRDNLRTSTEFAPVMKQFFKQKSFRVQREIFVDFKLYFDLKLMLLLLLCFVCVFLLLVMCRKRRLLRFSFVCGSMQK